MIKMIIIMYHIFNSYIHIFIQLTLTFLYNFLFRIILIIYFLILR